MAKIVNICFFLSGGTEQKSYVNQGQCICIIFLHKSIKNMNSIGLQKKIWRGYSEGLWRHKRKCKSDKMELL